MTRSSKYRLYRSAPWGMDRPDSKFHHCPDHKANHSDLGRGYQVGCLQGLLRQDLCPSSPKPNHSPNRSLCRHRRRHPCHSRSHNQLQEFGQSILKSRPCCLAVPEHSDNCLGYRRCHRLCPTCLADRRYRHQCPRSQVFRHCHYQGQ